MSTVYVVMGSTGEYSDHTTWAVCGYATEAEAERHAFEATKRAKHLMGREDEDDIRWDEERLRGWMGDLDPAVARMDSTGSDYFVLKVPMRADVPAAAASPETHGGTNR